MSGSWGEAVQQRITGGPPVRRTLQFLVVALVGAVILPVVAQSAPLPGGAAPLDVVVSLDRPASPGLLGSLTRLGTGVWAGQHIPVAALSIPAVRLDALSRLAGVEGVFPDQTLHYFSDRAVTALSSGAPAPAAGSGHGTHVAGDVAGRGVASNGAFQGSAPGASLVGLGAGEGLSVNTRSVLQGYDWIVAHKDQYGIRVVNNSFGGSFQPFNPLEPLNKATKAATDAGIVVVFAQGNDGDEMTMNDEATAPWVIAVAAATQTGGLADFTSGGLEADVVDPTFTANDVTG